jgi:hypothetical protein
MAQSKKPAAKKSAPKKPVPAKPAPKKPAPAKAAAAPAKAAPAKAAPAKPDAGRDAVAPDAPAAQLVSHAKALANEVRAFAAQLALAKVTPADAAQLDALAQELEVAESAWQIAWAKGAPGAVASTRTVLLRGRSDLFEALRVFALDDAATQVALDRIAGVEDDDDLAADASVLVPLARQHAGDLAGTEITPEVIDSVEAALQNFSAARAGARAVQDGTTTEQSLTESARKARAIRNRAFWSLAGLTRQVCLRGRFAFRHDAGRASKFVGYIRAGRSAKPAEPKPVEPAPVKPQG